MVAYYKRFFLRLWVVRGVLRCVFRVKTVGFSVLCSRLRWGCFFWVGLCSVMGSVGDGAFFGLLPRIGASLLC